MACVEGAIKQTKWRWFYPGEGDFPDSVQQIQEIGDFVQEAPRWPFSCPVDPQPVNVAGDLRCGAGRCRYRRSAVPFSCPWCESQKLDRVTRYQYNPEEGTVVMMDR